MVATGATFYQWQRDGVDIIGANTANYNISSVKTTDAGSYTCIVSDDVISVTSNAATLTVNTVPQITAHPSASVLAVSTQNVTLSVTATGTPTPTYQWQKDGVAISGATGATLTLSALQVSASGSYRCVVTNSVGSVNSNPCVLTVYAETNLAIRTQPLSQSLALGNNLTLSAFPTSIQPISYQWLKGGEAISGATGASYSIPAVSAGDAGNYQCQVRDTDEILLTNIASVTVYNDTALAIRSQPAAQVIVVGNSASFSLVATSGEPIGYQWRKNGVSISGATSSSYTIPAVSTTDAGTYSCIVSDYDELLLSSGATLTVQVPPAITSQPSSLTVLQNGSATFSVTATGTPAPTYQWRLNGTPITGATSATYTIASAQAANAGNYTCVVTNAAGSVTSSAATLTVNIPATITTQPSSQSAIPAGSATFGVTATGTGPLGYQWRKNGRDIAGATSSTLTLTNVRFLDEAKYSCLVSNAYGTSLSTAASLTITISPTSPDTDSDGISDALETYLSVFGLDPAIDSTEEWTRLLAMIPDLGIYYTADQMRNLAVGSPMLQRGANGNFLLDISVQESTNLNAWTNRTLSAPMITSPGGVLRVELPPLDSSTQFYRLRSQPAP